MFTVTVEHREIPFSDRAGLAAPPATVYRHSASSEAAMGELHFDNLGEPVSDWLNITEHKRYRQFVHRDRPARIDHHFTVTLETHLFDIVFTEPE